VTKNERVAKDTFLMTVELPLIAKSARTGQFINVKTSCTHYPFLRRPFSISDVVKNSCEILYHVVGGGTRQMSMMREGDTLDCIGPLGNSFTIDGSFTTAAIIAGGVGVAPFPFLTKELIRQKKQVITFLGARTKELVFDRKLENVKIATDDGTQGFFGNAVDAFLAGFNNRSFDKVKVFACGPTPMLKRVISETTCRKIACDVSLESEMACGIGLCQGCPVESIGSEKKYLLACTDGPNFSGNSIVLP